MENYLTQLPTDLRLLDLGDYLNSLLQKKKLSSKKLAIGINIPYRSIRNYFNNTRAISLNCVLRIINFLSESDQEKYLFLDNLYQQIKFVKSTSSKSKLIKVPKTFTKELAYLIGAIHDGTVFANVSKNQYVLQYWQYTDKKWLTTVSDKIESVFGIKPKNYGFYIQLSSKFVYYFLTKVLGVKQIQFEWDKFLWNIPKNLQLYAIAGMFDAEGWVGNKTDLRLKFSQKNKNKLTEIKEVLKNHGISNGKVISENEGCALWLCGKNCIYFATLFKDFCEHVIKRQKLLELSL